MRKLVIIILILATVGLAGVLILTKEQKQAADNSGLGSTQSENKHAREDFNPDALAEEAMAE